MSLPMNENQKTYTPTEVGTMFESLQSSITVVAESVQELSTRMDRVESRLTILESDMTIVKDAIRITFPVFDQRLKQVEAKLAG